MIWAAVAICATTVVSVVALVVLKVRESREREELVDDARDRESELGTISAVAEHQLERQPEIDAMQDASDENAAKRATAEALRSPKLPQETEHGFRGGSLPTSNFDDEIGL